MSSISRGSKNDVPPKKKRSLLEYITLMLRGMAMGASDIVPGVSGGTMAFILGIYEELIQSIRDVANPDFLKAAVRFDFKNVFRILNWQFLLAVGSGIILAALLLASLLESLLENQPVYLWSFFFGLVLASIYAVGKRIKQWNLQLGAILLVAAILAYILVGLVPAQTPNAPWFLFLSGAIAVCAMVLPGISGAFILVLLGKYEYVLTAIKDRDFLTILFVGLGAVIGIVSFAQVLGWLFKRYHNITVAALIGLMVGSLRKIWPWKLDTAWLLDANGEFILSDGHRIVTTQQNFLPTLAENGSGEIGLALLLAFIGFAIILVLDHYSPNEE